MSLESNAIFWLRWTKRCQVVITQRSPMRHGGIPDVLGITKARYCIEIESKRSMADFRANENKICVRNREVWIDRWPKLFYFIVPVEMGERALLELPDYAGLLHTSASDARVRVLREAPVNSASKRLTLKQCCHVMQLLCNELHWGCSRSQHRWAAQELSETDYVI